ncbi:hypothetical protein [Spiroplasma endosymbiont of Labia minor]|uniref:hypothetical protein n=1 Tax=Spiroplasma endosymbiont of Labia minor TaxID=3066305 RepID=UPI0030CC9828
MNNQQPLNNPFMQNIQTPDQAFAHVQNPFQAVNLNKFNIRSDLAAQPTFNQSLTQQPLNNQTIQMNNFQQTNPYSFMQNGISNANLNSGNLSYLLVPKGFGMLSQFQNSAFKVPVIDKTSQFNNIGFDNNHFGDFKDDYLFNENESIANSYKASILSNVNFVDAFDFDDTKI